MLKLLQKLLQSQIVAKTLRSVVPTHCKIVGRFLTVVAKLLTKLLHYQPSVLVIGSYITA